MMPKTTVTGEKYQVLILDDDYELGMMLREYLQHTIRCVVTCVNSEADFWASLNLKPFDILFLDYKLQGTTGLEILERMSAAGIHIPTVMMTGEGSENVAARAIQSGAMDYLVKGEYSFTTLPSLIQKAVRLREMQRAMQRSLEQISYQALLLDNMRDAVVVWGLDGTITYWNAAAEQLYGAPADGRLGQPVEQVYFPCFDPALSTQDIQQAGSLQLERRIISPAGQASARWVSAHISTLYNETNPSDPIGYMNVSRDISAIKRAEEQLLATQAHLAQAARLASIGELASGVAHQISNPLTTIIADAQILAQQLGPSHPGLESANAIVEAGWRAQRVINELMKFSQPGQSSQARVSINETIEQALLLAGADLQASGVQLDLALDPALPPVSANPRQLADVWINLLLARTSFSADAVRRIRIVSHALDGGKIRVEFSDDGSPIPPEEYDKIFEPRLIPTGAGRGTGMELSLCRELVRQNRGEIFLSGSGMETTFHITFSSEGL